jgi:MYXO-CTERM domain-containing protein
MPEAFAEVEPAPEPSSLLPAALGLAALLASGSIRRRPNGKLICQKTD